MANVSPSACIALKEGTHVAKTVLMPGDPLRARFIAEHYLENCELFNDVRNMLGYTGTYEGREISVMGSGMGMPSFTLYAYELYRFFGVEAIIRIGSAGGMAPEVLGGDVVIGTGAIRMEGTSQEYAPAEYPAVADYGVVSAMVDAAKAENIPFHVGVLHNKDNFYGQHSPDTMPVREKLKGKWQAFLDCGALASEMESAALFIICAVRRARGGCVVQVFANQTRRAMGLEDPMVLDTDAAVRVGVQGMRRLILRDKASE